MGKRVKVSMIWFEQGVRIQTVEGFTLPARTRVDMIIDMPRERKPPGTVEETTALLQAYKCMDCDFSTESLDEMTQHQRDGHSLKQKIKRALRF